ncbi:phage tail fiber protein [Microbispora amethystogenes]|uniref:phage tail fiber protein n=1 Tax=Microbispora amethystogenes TaxID=1427754 RepID=UPI003F4D0DC4
MSNSYLNATADAGGTLITYLGLVDGSGTEIAGGSYARQAVSWTAASNGLIRPTADKTFNVPSGATVAGWRGFSASSGGTNYGGADLTSQAFATAGTYTLLAASMGIDHDAT